MDVESTKQFAGDPDGLERLWTPHRMVYIGGENKPEDGQQDSCPFCAAPTFFNDLDEVDDAKGLIVFRGKEGFVVMNLYPYNSGHLLVCPYRHMADYTELTLSERIELGELTSQAMIVLRQVLHPQGFNLGMNQGTAAGAGIAAHLHQHVVPRWEGDANFFPLIAQTKALPELLEDTRQRLAAAWLEER